MIRAAGTFDVELTAQPLAHPDADAMIGRRSIDTQFHGDLEGASTGELLSAGTQLEIIVVPDSATGGLAGLSGRMKIIIEAGKHSYEFDYTLD
jgi:Protein of unknown function (DUF3224)